MKMLAKELIFVLVVVFFLATPAWAGQQASAEADYTLGMKYFVGTGGVDQNLKQAAEWFRKAAELGLARAQYRLGQAYESGQGVPQNFKAAQYWYMQAATQNDGNAQSALGDLYTTGHGVKPDPVQAAEWLYKAADQGITHAQAELGKLYFSGTGVKQDDVEAYFWLGLAAKELEEAMDKRDEVGEHLTSDQLRDVRLRIETWRPDTKRRGNRSGKL